MRDPRCLIIAALLMVCCWPIASKAGEPEALAALQRRAAEVTTIQSDFVQEKHLAIFNEVLVSKGRFFYVRPDRLRWELTEPVAAGFALNGKQGRRWNTRSGQSQSFELAREPVMKLVADQLFAWTGADFDRMRTSYRIIVAQQAPVTLRLEPLAGAAGFLDHLQVAFSADGQHLTTVEVYERGGDFTRIRFLNTVINAPLDNKLF